MYHISNSSAFWGRQESHSLSSRPAAPNGQAAGNDKTATDKLLDQLAKRIPGMQSAKDFAQLKAEDFTPQKVADRIGGFVAQGLDAARRSGKSEAEVEALYNQAVSGIQKGFEEAQAALDNLGMLNDDLTATIDETLQLTLQGLADQAPGATPQNRLPTSSHMLAAQRYQAAESLSLQVKTRDGDTVSIQFRHASDYQSSMGYAADETGGALSFGIDRSESSSYRFSVEGNLDEEEIDALQNLIKDVSEIADEFFDGDVQSAFEQASEFKMDRSELASMNLQLTRSETYSAVAAYQQVQDLDHANPGQGRKLGHLMNDLAGQVSDPKLGFLASPMEFGQELLANLIPQDQRYREADDHRRNLLDQNLQTMKDLLDDVVSYQRGDD